MPLLIDIPENKSAFVQKIKGKEAISSPREVGHTPTRRQNCPLFAVYALNLQEVSSSRRSLRVTCLNALGTETCSFYGSSFLHWWLLPVSNPRVEEISMSKFRVSEQVSRGPSSWEYPQCLPSPSQTVTTRWLEIMRQIGMSWHRHAAYPREARCSLWSPLPVTSQWRASVQGCCPRVAKSLKHLGLCIATDLLDSVFPACTSTFFPFPLSFTSSLVTAQTQFPRKCRCLSS